MKKKLIYLLAIFVIFGIVITIGFFLQSRKADEGKLRILTSPTADISINNEPAGKTPYEKSLPEGEYLVRLVPNEQNASESAEWNGKVNVYSNTLTFVNRELGKDDISSSGVIFSVTKMEAKGEKGTGEIEVTTEPDGAIVFLDNEEQGIAPLVLSDVPAGDHELSVFSPGFFRRSQKVKVQEGFRIIADYKLAIDPTHKKVEKIEDDEATDSAELDGGKTLVVVIADTGTGWLRVREEASLDADEVAKVDTGKRFKVLEEDDDWYKIMYDGENEGWISTQYANEVTDEEEEDPSEGEEETDASPTPEETT